MEYNDGLHIYGDDLKIYFNEISRYNLLSESVQKDEFFKLNNLKSYINNNNITDEYINLLVKKYGYNKIIKKDILSRKYQLKYIQNYCDNKEKKDFEKYIEYLECIDLLVTSNLKLVVKCAIDYCKTTINIMNYIQEGNVELRNAVLNYDVNKDIKFSTYACKCIYNGFYMNKKFEKSYFNYSRNDRVKFKIYLNYLKDYYNYNGCYPTYDEKLSFVYNSIVKVSIDSHNKKYSDSFILEKAKADLNCFELMYNGSNMIYLDNYINEEGQNGYVFISQNLDSDETSFELKYIFKEIFNDLTPREIIIIALRNGLNIYDYLSRDDVYELFKDLSSDDIREIEKNRDIKSFEEIASYFNVKKQAINNTYNRLLIKLKNNKKQFSGYID